MADFQYTRLPAVDRKISEINPETDIRVRIVGTVIDNADSEIVIDDGSGKAVIIFDESVPELSLVRIFARVIPTENGYELRGEIIQDMQGLNINLYKKIISK
ncbi:MAG: replication protein RepA [Candidatus Aenigmatarchaeota archaeon]